MKTLVIISHPTIKQSNTQQFLLSSVPQQTDHVTVHHLETIYPDGKIDSAQEQSLLFAHDRILLQFPLYWYSSPYLLKKWLDEVLDFSQSSMMKRKELGIVVSTGIHQKEFAAGGREHFSLDELLRPFQAIANKLGMTYLKVFPIYQFDYLTDTAKQELLVHYQLLLANPNDDSLQSRTQWCIQTLRNLDLASSEKQDHTLLEHVLAVLAENDDTIEELEIALNELKE